MEHHKTYTTLNGQPALLTKQICLVFLIVDTVMSIAIAGRYWYWLFGVCLLLSIPSILLLRLIGGKLKTLTFDDENKLLIGGSQKIPYNHITKVYITDTDGVVNVDIKVSPTRKITIAMGFQREDIPKLITAFSERFPSDTIHKRSIPTLRIIMALSLVLIVFLVALHKMHPTFKTTPKTWQVETTGWKTQKIQTYTIDGISFTLPEGFVQRKRTENKLILESKHPKIGVYVELNPYYDILSESKIPLKLLGIKNSYSMLHAVLYEQVGIIPLILKQAWLRGVKEVYSINLPNIKGFIFLFLSAKHNYPSAEMILLVEGTDIGFLLYGESIQEDLINHILSSITTNSGG